ncbi:hypothetical protein SO802_013877 [Lithocarpus litseifolius]|uniref:ABC transporter domain-containing protein n=1 Tax=Lithocarpus litseifolius TaxID=425828 RepID=A0AAW2DAY9_9ROSI
MKDEESRRIVAIKAFKVAEKRIKENEVKLVESEKGRKSAEAAVDNVERQGKSQRLPEIEEALRAKVSGEAENIYYPPTIRAPSSIASPDEAASTVSSPTNEAPSKDPHPSSNPKETVELATQVDKANKDIKDMPKDSSKEGTGSHNKELVLGTLPIPAKEWAAIERLPTFEWLRSSLFDNNGDVGGTDNKGKRVIDVTKLGAQERHLFIEKLIKHIEHDNLHLLRKIKNRIDKETTLLDVLAGRKTSGYIERQIKIGGYPKVQETFARVSGYCEQTDIHSPQITVEESVIFSAWLRLSPHIDAKTKAEFVNEFLDTTELDGIKDALVGKPGVTGLSNEQRKRLTIAVELVANPSIIFMDEPTTGLDARAAAIVMRAVKNAADTGRTIVCTIHQPSIDIFEAFDELILLKTGGHLIYSGQQGEHSSSILEYFESIPGVPKIRNNYKPAAWMLDVTSTSAEAKLGKDFALKYRESALYE